MKDPKYSDPVRFPKTRASIDINNYYGLVTRVLKDVLKEDGEWLKRYDKQLVKAGVRGVRHAKKQHDFGPGSFIALAYLCAKDQMKKEIIKVAKRERTYPETNEEIDVNNYSNLVVKVFKGLIQKFGPWINRHRDDLIQQGYIGLIKAKEKYTPGRGSFIALAYLRIMSAMQEEIAKYAKYEMNTTPIEEIKHVSGNEDADKLDWADMFPGDIIDYGVLLRMVEDNDDRKVLFGLIETYPYWKLRAIMKESKEDHEIRVVRIKENLKELLEILHPNL
jgi:hypothetical protein